MSIAASTIPPVRVDDEPAAIVTDAPDDAASSHPYGGRVPAGFDVRALGEDELPAVMALGFLAFHSRPPGEAEERARRERFLRGARLFGAYDGDELAGVAGALPLELSVPGGALPCAGLTWVAVAPTHRRRGALTGLMGAVLGDARARGEPLAALWAAESAIYGRFGFGLATYQHALEVSARRPLELRIAPDPRSLRMVDLEAAPRVLAAAHARERGRRPGLPARTPEWWRTEILRTDPEEAGEGLTDARVVLLGESEDPAGYAIYRVRPGPGDEDADALLEVAELVADEPAGVAALWRFLVSIDLVATVRALRPPDDPLPLMAADPDRVRVTRHEGAMWLRLVDVPAALAARAYATDVALTLGVRDERLPENAGSWRLESGRCARADGPPDLELDVRDLAAAYLGGVAVGTLRAAGLVDERTAGAADRLDAALRTPLAPFLPDDF
jgi:predicted acetyltransferase